MTRLTKDLRSSIAYAAVAHAFDPRQDALNKEEDALGREAYAAVLTPAEIKAVKAVPQNWFRSDSCLRFNAGGYTVKLTVSDGMPVPYAPKGDRGGYHCGMLGSIPAGDLCDRIQTHVKAVETYREERYKAKQSVLVMLGGVSTLKQLREAWPEGESFFSRHEAVSTGGNLPAVRVDEVNAMLGLAS